MQLNDSYRNIYFVHKFDAHRLFTGDNQRK